MKKLCVLVLVLTTAVVLGQDSLDDIELSVPVAAPMETEGAGTVYFSNGPASVYPDGKSSEKRDLQKYDTVIDEDTIDTSGGGELIIELRDNKGFIHIDKDTVVRLDYSYSARYNSYKTILVLDKGTVRVYFPPLTDMRSNCTIITPNASIGTGGGDMLIRFYAGNTFVYNYMGTAPVKHLLDDLSSKGKTYIEGGQKIQVSSSKGLSRPGEVKDAEFDRKFWAEHDVELTYPRDETRQDQLINREINRIEADRRWASPMRLTR